MIDLGEKCAAKDVVRPRRGRTTAPVLALCVFVGVSASGCVVTAVDFSEFSDDVRKAQAELRTDLAEFRNASVDNQREIEVVKAQIDEVRHQNELISKPSDEAKRLSEIEKRTVHLEESLRSIKEQLRISQEDLRLVREDLRIQREELKSAMGFLPLPGQPTTVSRSTAGEGEQEDSCDFKQSELVDVPMEYFEALRSMCSKDFKGAIAKFREFREKFPNGDLAENAQYWIGELYFALKEYERAILELQGVVKIYPKSDRVPAALLKQAFSFYELGYPDDARLIIEKLMQEYPSTREAKQGRERLNSPPRRDNSSARP